MSAPANQIEAFPTTTTDSDGPAADTTAVPINDLWWLGCHGGAGVSTLAYLTGIGHDCRQALPRRDFANLPGLGVILVFSASANGVFAAQYSMHAYQALEHRPRLLGLVAVAASPTRTSRLVRERLHVLASQVPRLWELPWVDAFVAAHDPAAVGAPPSYQALSAELRTLVTAPVDAAATAVEAPVRADGD